MHIARKLYVHRIDRNFYDFSLDLSCRHDSSVRADNYSLSVVQDRRDFHKAESQNSTIQSWYGMYLA